jgi:5-formyltetrahydrofolate cyclo-ligase
MADTMSADKQAIRQRIWDALEQSGAAPRGAHGRIPDFEGSDRAADRLAELDAWRAAHVLKANPDRAQLPVRQRALHDGKLVYMAVPKPADIRPFFRLDPDELRAAGLDLDEVAAHRVAAQSVPKVHVTELRPVDLIVCGSVAVDRCGVRIGKGAGYSDIEVGLLAEAGLISERTTIVTTVHQLQVADDPLPHDRHDFTVDYIVTPEQVISCTGPTNRPTGLVWEDLTAAQAAAIPVLTGMAPLSEHPETGRTC